jgi:hypothetical protein
VQVDVTLMVAVSAVAIFAVAEMTVALFLLQAYAEL